MGIDRRKFLKLSGIGAIGLACKPVIDLFASAKIPEDSPLAGKRLAMVIDLKRCQRDKNCTACIDACHQIHNVPTDFENDRHEIKWIWKEEFRHAFHEQDHEYLNERFKHGPALVLCNHCDNPPCVRVCPTQATWKREEDGIVMMDWHRCIGCRYCIAACPYGSRSFNWFDPRKSLKNIDPGYPTRMRGVVEKCTFCEERLVQGMLPACVESCKYSALSFGDLDDPNSRVSRILKARFAIRRKPALGTQPQVYYIV